MNFFHRYRPRKPRGIDSGEAAAQWASTRFDPHLRRVGAYVAELLCDLLGIQLSAIEPHTTFTVADLRLDWAEAAEIGMALEEDLGFAIPREDAARLNTVSELVAYLHQRLSSDG